MIPFIESYNNGLRMRCSIRHAVSLGQAFSFDSQSYDFVIYTRFRSVVTKLSFLALLVNISLNEIIET